MSLQPFRHRPTAEGAAIPEEPLGPFEAGGLVLVTYPSNHPLFVAAAVGLNRDNTSPREHMGVRDLGSTGEEAEYRRTLSQQNTLHMASRVQNMRTPVGVLAVNNDKKRGAVTPVGYAYSHQTLVEQFRRLGFATTIGDLIVDRPHVGRGLGAMMARFLIGNGSPLVVDGNGTLFLLPQVIDPPEQQPAAGPLIAQWAEDESRLSIRVLEDLARIYPGLPDCPVEQGAPLHA